MSWNHDRAFGILSTAGAIVKSDPMYGRGFEIAGVRTFVPRNPGGKTVAYINEMSAAGENVSTILLKPEYGEMEQFTPRGGEGIRGSASRFLRRDQAIYRFYFESEDQFEMLLDWYAAGRSQVANNAVLKGNEPIPINTDGSDSDSNDFDSGTPETKSEPQGTGLEPDPRVRKAVEDHAVLQARTFYEALGYSVEERGKPFDLLCEQLGDIIHAEVKGSRSSMQVVILTTNEVMDARKPEWISDLFLVENIKLEPNGEDGYKASGGHCRRVENWVPLDQDLTSTHYRYSLPSITDA